MRSLLAGLLTLIFISPALAQKEFGFDNRKGSGQPYLKPEETVAKFKVAPEFEVKLFAGEPLMTNPIAFTIDERGRIWVVESFEYPRRTPKGKKPRDRIVILEDTDGDGKADKRTVFAEGKDFPETFDLASGIEVGHGGVYLGAPPYLWFIENKNDKPGKFEILARGFGSQDTHETLNTFQWGPDGWLYGLHGVFTQSNVKVGDEPEIKMNAAVWRFHPKTKQFEIFSEGTSNPWGMDWRNTDGQFILACCVIPHLYHMVPGAIYQRQGGASNNPYHFGFIKEISDHTFHRESGWAHAGLISLDVPHIPEKYRNSVIFGSIHGCSLKQNILKPNGSSYIASKGEDFLVSGDKNFRPINLKWGPLGDIYLIDWHDQNPCHQTKPDEWDYERGRVYRIQLKGTTPKKAEDLGTLTVEELCKMTNDPNPYRYRTSLRLLSERKLGAVTLTTTKDTIRYYWTSSAVGWYDITGTINDDVAAVTEKHEWHLRRVANRPEVTDKTIAAFAGLAATTPSPAVRRELASAAIRLADKHNVMPLVHALMSHKENANDPLIPQLTWLAYEKSLMKTSSKAAGTDANGKPVASTSPLEGELAWLAEQAPNNIFVRDQMVPKVMRRLVATGKPEHLAMCVKFVADVSDTNTREKALDGLTLALAGQTVDAPGQWKYLQPELRKDARLVSLVNKLAVSFRDPEAVKRALQVLIDPKQNDESRMEAVRQLSQLKSPEARSLFPQIVQKDPSEKVRIEAARGLASFDDPKIVAELLAGWSHYRPLVRSEVVATLTSRKEWAKQMLTAMRDKKLDREALNDSAITRIQGFRDRQLDQLIEKAWGKTRATPADLNQLIEKMRAELATGTASFERGRLVFEAQCAKCHKFEGKGNEVGPALDGAGRDIEYLLGNILDPNRVIGAPYFVRQIATQDGQLTQGLLTEEDDRSITLKIENGILRRILKSEMDGPVKVLEKSMMPEGLAAGMTTQDFRNLVRYVMAHPFPSVVKIRDKSVSVPVTGMIPLPAGEPNKPLLIQIEVEALDSVKTQLLVGTADPFEVLLDGSPVGSGKGAGNNRPNPDRESINVQLPKGKHTVSILLHHKGAVSGMFARFLDPDRKLRYVETAK